MEIARAPLLKNFKHIIQYSLDRFVPYLRKDRLLELDAPDLQPVLIGTLKLFTRIGRSIFVLDSQCGHALLQSLYFSLQGLLVLFA